MQEKPEKRRKVSPIEDSSRVWLPRSSAHVYTVAESGERGLKKTRISSARFLCHWADMRSLYVTFRALSEVKVVVKEHPWRLRLVPHAKRQEFATYLRIEEGKSILPVKNSIHWWISCSRNFPPRKRLSIVEFQFQARLPTILPKCIFSRNPGKIGINFLSLHHLVRL